MEDHLLEIFCGHDTKEIMTKSLSTDMDMSPIWNPENTLELNKIPRFVRDKVKTFSLLIPLPPSIKKKCIINNTFIFPIFKLQHFPIVMYSCAFEHSNNNTFPLRCMDDMCTEIFLTILTCPDFIKCFDSVKEL
jgi:hypothetical protein